MRVSCLLVAGVWLTGFTLVTGGRQEEPPITSQAVSDAQAEFFEAKIRPILDEHCFKCHGPRKQESGLRLDSRERLLRGNDAGPVVVPGRPDESPLIEAIGHRWRDQDAPQVKAASPGDCRSDEVGPDGPTLAREPQYQAQGLGSRRRCRLHAKQHWAFQPVSDPAPPEVKAKAWPRTPIDRFILAKLEATGTFAFAACRPADLDPPRIV